MPDESVTKTIIVALGVCCLLEKGSYEKIALPVNGKGLWSTMYGFIALDKDIKTVQGFTFYEHKEELHG